MGEEGRWEGDEGMGGEEMEERDGCRMNPIIQSDPSPLSHPFFKWVAQNP